MSLARSAATGIAVGLAAFAAGAVELDGVYHEPALLPAVGEQRVAIHFQLSHPADVAVHLYDGRGLRVRSLDAGRKLPAGQHLVAWDGRDARGRPVPPEAYTYALEAVDAAGERSSWDIADTAGEPIDVERVSWEPESGSVRYSLSSPGRVRIRIGLADQGPLLATLLDWVPRTAGVHSEPWNGRDASGLVDLSRHPHLELVAEAFTLPRNAILVGPPPRVVKLLDGLDTGARRSSSAERPKRMYDYASQPIEQRRDFPVHLEVLGDPARGGDGLPVVSGPVALRVSVDEADLAALLDERFEIVFYLDGRFLFETETGFLPMTWRWEASDASAGEHYLTTNVRGYEGHFGMGTLKVHVAPVRADSGGGS